MEQISTSHATLSAADAPPVTPSKLVEPCPHGAILSLSFGILLFWSMSDQAMAYLIGDHPRMRTAAKIVLAMVVCLAVPVAALVSFIQRVVLPDKCDH